MSNNSEKYISTETPHNENMSRRSFLFDTVTTTAKFSVLTSLILTGCTQINNIRKAKKESKEAMLIEEFSQAGFYDITGEFGVSQMKEKYLKMQTKYYKILVEPQLIDAEFSDEELKTVLDLIKSGEIILTNSGFYCCDTFDGAFNPNGMPLYEYLHQNDYGNKTKFSLKVEKELLDLKYENVSMIYVGHPKIVINDNDPVKRASFLAHEFQHLLDETGNYSLVELEYRARYRECLSWSKKEWEGFDNTMAYFIPGKGPVGKLELYQSAMKKDIKHFFDIHSQLYENKKGWVLTPELIKKYEGFYPLEVKVQ